MACLMKAHVAAVCGPRGKHDPVRTAVRHGRGRGSVTLGGRRVGVDRPPMRASHGGEVPVAAYELFSRSEILGRMAMATMLGGLSSRRYQVGAGLTMCGATATPCRPPQGRGDGRQLPAVAHLAGTPGQGQLARPQEPGAIAEWCSETCRVTAAKASLRRRPPGGTPMACSKSVGGVASGRHAVGDVEAGGGHGLEIVEGA